MTGDGVAGSLGQIVTYLVTVGGASAVLGRFIVDWRMRELRKPSMASKPPTRGRAEMLKRQEWSLWIGTITGAVGGVGTGVVTLAIDLIQR